jgi:glyoxylase-like metal-dependent hydrolase (beta-lactamase superfamily II)
VLKRLALVLVVLLAVAGTFVWWQTGRIDVQQIGPDLYVLTGLGGNVGVLTTDEGVVVVDTMTLVRQGDAILARIQEVSDKPVAAILNTHYHLDHTHGNPAFVPGTRVIATARTLTHLRERDTDYWRDSPARDLLPNVTFDGAYHLTLGGKTVRAIHFGRGHTDGDLVVLFVEDRVLHAGDLFFNGHYPNIDLEAGGTLAGWAATLGRVLELPFDRVIPGHGPVTDREGLRRFQEFISSLWAQTKTIAAGGGTLDDALEKVDLTAFALRRMWYAPQLGRSFVIRRAYEEATRRPGS